MNRAQLHRLNFQLHDTTTLCIMELVSTDLFYLFQVCSWLGKCVSQKYPENFSVFSISCILYREVNNCLSMALFSTYRMLSANLL